MENSAPPAGGDRNRGATILGVTYFFTLMSIIFVSLRVCTRLRLIGKMWWDDWLSVLTIILAAPLPIFWTFYVHGGGARHVYYLSSEQREDMTRINWISQPFGVLAFGTGKASVAFSILRYQSPNKWRTRILYFIALSITLLCILNCILIFIQCDPARALWDPELASTAKCWAPQVSEYYAIAQSCYSVSVDFILVYIATTIVWNLQLSLSRRIQLALLLSTGILDGIFGIVKTTKLTEESARSDYTCSSPPFNSTSKDTYQITLWNTFPLFMWTIGELHSIIIGSCLPTLRPLYLIVFKRPGREIYVAKKSRAQRAKLYDFNSSIKLSSNPNTPHNQNRDLENSEDVYISQQDNEGIRHVVETDEVQLLKLDWTRSREACLLSTTTFNLDVRAE